MKAGEAGAAAPVLSTKGLTVRFDGKEVLSDVTFDVPACTIVALIGPSGGGKSTLLRSFNRMNDLVPKVEVEGSIYFKGMDVYGEGVDPVEVRRRVGMVFQQPTPFPKSIFENVAFGWRAAGYEGDLDQVVEDALTAAGLWPEVFRELHQSALELSLGQQQRLCLARTLAVTPEVLLMDEPTSALDPIATKRIEELIRSLKASYTIVIVTHNLAQAARLSDLTAYLDGGRLVEYGPTETVFTNPEEPETEAYVTRRVG